MQPTVEGSPMVHKGGKGGRGEGGRWVGGGEGGGTEHTAAAARGSDAGQRDGERWWRAQECSGTQSEAGVEGREHCWQGNLMGDDGRRY